MRLIDADALKASFPKAQSDIFQNCRRCTCMDNEEIDAVIDSAPTVSGWVSVKDGLPDKPCICLVFNKYGWGALDRWEGDSWILAEESEITHWMLLPEPPKGCD